MRIDIREEFDYPVDLVFHTFRDRITEYTEHCPNITNINIKKREQISDTQIHQHCEWEGAGDIPGPVRKVLKPDMLRWDDYQQWDSTDRTNTWEIKPVFFREHMHCSGVWKFEALGDDRAVAICDGVFNVNITRMPPFPSFMLKGISPVVEKFVGGHLEPNMIKTFNAIRQYLSESV